MATFDEIVDKTLVKEDIKNTQFMLLIKYRDDYNKTKNEAEKKKNLINFRKLYKKMKDSLTPDEDEELVKSLSDKMLGIYYEDISEPEPVSVSDDNEEIIKQRLRNLRVLRHIETLGKASKKSKKSRKKSRKKKSKKRRRSKTSKK